jgi:hypothetical protein
MTPGTPTRPAPPATANGAGPHGAPSPDPGAEYERRRAAREAAAERERRRDGTIANLRLAAGLAAALIAWLAFAQRALPALWLLAPLAAFAGLVLRHARVRAACTRAERAAYLYARGLERLAGTWAGRGEPGERFKSEEHPYTADLDLFGAGSLYELLCTARTSRGQETLASWLLGPAAPEEIRARQAAVAELGPMLDLREDLAVLGPDVEAGVDPADLKTWGTAAPQALAGPALRVAALVLAALGIGALIGWFWFGLGLLPLAAVALADIVLERMVRARADRVLHAADHAAGELALLAHLLARIERESFAAPRLRALAAGLATGGVPASRQIARLVRLIDLADSQHNLIFAPIAFLLQWRLHLALAIEGWRRTHGAAIAGWLDAVGEIEALAALASHGYEHPADPFPEIASAGPLFAARGLAHPLIAEREVVRNDVRLDGTRRVLVISGSNMSGKSTLLRTVGVNAVLALAGGPVRATELALSPLTIGATLAIHDSLRAGVSRFYAEITRLKQLVELTRGPAPLLFLCDELLHGTNSHDRKIGAEAIVRNLVEHGAIGLVTTHDLALAHVAEALAPAAANVHFADHLENGAMVFDYRMRPGVVEKSNALALMRAVGLEV